MTKRYFFIMLLPIVWIIVSFVSYYHPGDEYAMYAISNIIGVWPFFLFEPPDVHGLLFPSLVAVIGGLTLAGIGFGLDRLRGNRWVWAVSWVMLSMLLAAFQISQYPTVQKALSKNGSWTAYIAGAMNIGLYFSVLVSAVSRTIILLIKRVNPQKQQEQKK